MLNPEATQRIDDRVDDCSWRTNSAGFANALRSERVVRTQSDDSARCVIGQICGRRHEVVEEVGSNWLACRRLVHHALEQRLSDTLGDSAVHLPLGQERVDHRATIVDDDHVANGDTTGLAIDLDHAAVRPRRIGEVRRLVEETLLQRAGLQFGRQRQGLERRPRYVRPADLLTRRAAHVECIVRHFQVELTCLQQVGGDLFCPRQHSGRRDLHGRTAGGHPTRPHCADALQHGCCVTHAHLDAVERDAQLVRGDLRERGLVALPVRRGSSEDDRRTVGLNAHLRRLPRSQMAKAFQRTIRPKACDLQPARQPNT